MLALRTPDEKESFTYRHITRIWPKQKRHDRRDLPRIAHPSHRDWLQCLCFGHVNHIAGEQVMEERGVDWTWVVREWPGIVK